MTRIHYIVNPTAGSGKAFRQWQKLEPILKRRGLNYDVSFTNGVRHATELAKEVCDHVNVIVAVGGDGTVHEVANGILLNETSTTALCVLPVGTGNDFASAWKMPGTIEKHIDLLNSHQVTSQDVLMIEQIETGGKKYCISMSGIGLDSEVVVNINAYRQVKRSGKLIYLLAALKAVQRFKPLKIDVKVFNENELVIHEGLDQKVLTIAFGIHKTNGGGLMQCPDANPTDGLVDVTVVESLNGIDIAQVATSLFTGSLLKHKRVKAFKGKSILIERLGGWQLEADGELVGTPPFRLTVKEKALKLLVPKS